MEHQQETAVQHGITETNGLGITIPLSPELVEQLRIRKTQQQQQSPSLVSEKSVPLALVPLSRARPGAPATKTAATAIHTGGLKTVAHSTEISPASTHSVVIQDDDPVSDYEDNETATVWDDVMAPFPPPKLEHVADTNDEENEDALDDGVSTTPPPNLPVLIVDLQALFGYIPTSTDQKKELKSQIIIALTQDTEKENHTSDSNNNDDAHTDDDVYDAPRYFDQRSLELLQTNMDLPSDTSSHQNCHLMT